MVRDRKSGTGHPKNGPPGNPQWMDPAARSDRFEKPCSEKIGRRTTLKSCTQRSGKRIRHSGQTEDGKLRSADNAAFLHGHFYSVFYGLFLFRINQDQRKVSCTIRSIGRIAVTCF